MKKNQIIRLLKGYVRHFKLKYLGGLILILIGGGMAETVFMDETGFGFKALLVILFFCLPLFWGGCIVLIQPFFDIEKGELEQDEKESMENGEYQAGSLRSALQSFRERLKEYYRHPQAMENSSIQGFVTQVFFQILRLQKRRLEQKGLLLTLETKSKNHGGGTGAVPAIRERSYDDGKYKISQVAEQISGIKSYSKAGKILYRKKQDQTAEYTLLTAFQKGGNKVVCPSCANITTRENLLDGCDFCKTKFVLEDLGERVQSFSFGTDYEVQYSKYKKVRSLVWRWGAILGGIPGAMIPMMIGIRLYFDLLKQGEKVGFFLFSFSTLIAMAAFALLSSFLVFVLIWFILFPIAQTISGLRYMRGKEIQKAKERLQIDTAAENAVRSYDVRFSLQGFYGSIKNKLAGIHFADSKQEINDFTNCDISCYLPKYQSIIDMETDYIVFENYFIENNIQNAQVTVGLNLLSLQGDRIKSAYERIGLHLIKSASCKTQAVSGPEVIRCEGCGSSISLLEGRFCKYCTRPIPMFQYDWVINDYRVC